MNLRLADPQLSHAGYRGVKLSEADAEAGERLSAEAQWNQTTADWDFMLKHGDGLGFESSRGELVASALLLPYGADFAWISMVLVSAAARRQGLATLLLHRALALAAERSLRPLLDATPEGRRVYLPLGFRDLHGLTRWSSPRIGKIPRGSPVHPITRLVSLPRWEEWDAPRFGASRANLLGYLHRSQPDLALQATDFLGAPAGYGLARAGRTAVHLGPLVAHSETIARDLLCAALDSVEGPALVDLVDGRPLLASALRERGFTPARTFTRMIRGAGEAPGRQDCIFAVTGPEFG